MRGCRGGVRQTVPGTRVKRVVMSDCWGVTRAPFPSNRNMTSRNCRNERMEAAMLGRRICAVADMAILVHEKVFLLCTCYALKRRRLAGRAQPP